MYENINTPAYIFDSEEFERQTSIVKEQLGEIALTYSIKANAFLLNCLPDTIQHVEVCSPGELQICKKYGIEGKKIIYSGVNKEESDITDAISYGVDIATAESLKHVQLEQKVAKKFAIKQKVLLRLTSGNQFGMSEEDIHEILGKDWPNLEIIGLHYYSGTQKKLKQINKDLTYLGDVIEDLKVKYKFKPQLVEYGPGLPVNYFIGDSLEYLSDVVILLRDFSEKYPLGIEMGRFLASSCGMYATKVMDIKQNDNTNYIICDGGIHHLKYYGQMMAMQVPEIEVLNFLSKEEKNYCLCGSLCTVADVLVRDVKLPTLQETTIILFKNCGAYSVTEGSSLFLSRKLPNVYLLDKQGTLNMVRDSVDTYNLKGQNP